MRAVLIIVIVFTGCGTRERKSVAAVSEAWNSLLAGQRGSSNLPCAQYGRFGFTLLHRAAILGNTNILAEILHYCHNIDAPTKAGSFATPLMFAAGSGNADCVKV